MLRHSEFLSFRPSQIAAATLICAMTNCTPLTKFSSDNKSDALSMWTRQIEKITQINKEEDLRPVYDLLKAKMLSCDWN